MSEDTDDANDDELFRNGEWVGDDGARWWCARTDARCWAGASWSGGARRATSGDAVERRTRRG